MPLALGALDIVGILQLELDHKPRYVRNDDYRLPPNPKLESTKRAGYVIHLGQIIYEVVSPLKSYAVAVFALFSSSLSR